MPKPTLHSRLVTWIMAMPDAKELTSPSRKYRKFQVPGVPEGQFLWVGKAGALRRGPTATNNVNAIHLFPYPTTLN